MGGDKFVILDRGNVELAIPRDWTVKPDPAGFLKLEDSNENCLLEVSYLRLPPLREDAPSVEERLRHVLVTSEHPAGDVKVIETKDVRAAWTDYPYVAADRDRKGNLRAARGRWLVAANTLFQVLMTFYYWADDATWAVPAWETIVRSLRLGDGTQFGHPFEHWSLGGAPES